ncbi:hypothetical protein B0T24DRAFT_591034 [Lasiosphaeria ovina]|uniref:Uncharacterized protein n=1 Tax=Lasiosphaeria ovina TaxID=92902 RepID=A0AAE0TUP8_9PEZI|nr:hypothetical protein B0T24DRAFT_591034 [Lasiosphaeria ovina]
MSMRFSFGGGVFRFNDESSDDSSDDEYVVPGETNPGEDSDEETISDITSPVHAEADNRSEKSGTISSCRSPISQYELETPTGSQAGTSRSSQSSESEDKVSDSDATIVCPPSSPSSREEDSDSDSDASTVRPPSSPSPRGGDIAPDAGNAVSRPASPIPSEISSEYSDTDIPFSLEPQPKELCRRCCLCCRRPHHVLEDEESEVGYDPSLPRPEPTFRDRTLNRYPDEPYLHVPTYVPGSGPPLTQPTLLLSNEGNKARIMDTSVRIQGLRKTIFYQLMYPDEGDVKGKRVEVPYSDLFNHVSPREFESWNAEKGKRKREWQKLLAREKAEAKRLEAEKVVEEEKRIAEEKAEEDRKRDQDFLAEPRLTRGQRRQSNNPVLNKFDTVFNKRRRLD